MYGHKSVGSSSVLSHDTMQTLPTDVMDLSSSVHRGFHLSEHLDVALIPWYAGWNPTVIAATSAMPETDGRFTQVLLLLEEVVRSHEPLRRPFYGPGGLQLCTRLGCPFSI